MHPFLSLKGVTNPSLWETNAMYYLILIDLPYLVCYTLLKLGEGGYMETAVTIKGQVVIPAKLRHRLGIKKGTKLYVEERKGEIILRPLNREYFQKMSGILKGGRLVKALEESRAEDLKREEENIGRRKGSR
jgi:AbrB family looped-hinge helix DNA binding protein